MKAYALIFLCLGVLLAGTAAPAAGQYLPVELKLFDGGPVADSQITVGGWGSGACEETREIVYTGQVSLKMKIGGMYSGARLDFAEPVDLSPLIGQDAIYMQFTVRSTNYSGRRERDLEGLDDLGIGAGSGGGSGPSRPFVMSSQVPVAVSPISKIRILLYMEDGSVASCDSQPVESYKIDTSNWVKYWIPLPKIVGLEGAANPKVKRLVFLGNARDTLYLGDLSIVKDDSPIAVYPGDEYVRPINDKITFKARADGGAAALAYSWDFDDSDGITEEATGYMAQHQYTKTGEYTVTCTVRDLNGIKEPVTITYKVRITV